jgi:hypothetical protein
VIDAEEFRVRVGTDYLQWEGLAVHVAARVQGQLHLAQPVDLIATAEPVSPGTSYADQPTLRIPDALGRALLEALSAHYGGVADVRQALKDRDRESSRVDRLLEVVSSIAVASRARQAEETR